MDNRRKGYKFNNNNNNNYRRNNPRYIDNRGGNNYASAGQAHVTFDGPRYDGNDARRNWKNREVNFKNLNKNSRFKVHRKVRPNEDISDPEQAWFKIMIPRGARCSKEHLISSLQQNMGSPIVPLNFHTEGNVAVFYVQGADQASAIKACGRRIYDNNQYALNVNMSPSSIPIPPMDKTTEDNITEAMKRRYNLNVKSLFLQSFATEPGLLEVNLYIPLSRMSLFNLVVEKIRKEYPDIIGLSIADNKITTLQPLTHLQPVCKSLKALDISKNKIKNINELDNIKGFELEELAVEGNPFAQYFTEAEKSSLISSIRSRFPKLNKLDGNTLPPSIGFDIGDTGEIPPSYGHHIPNEVRNFVGEFLEQYFKIYDSEDRRPMLAAYHDQAVFSYSIGRTDNKQTTFTQSMISGSRNLLRIRDEGEQKIKLLHRGGPAVVDALMAMPKTKHSYGQMIIDVPFYCNQSFFVIVVNGVLKEFTKKQVHIRAFCRTFLIVPQGQGFVIINDILLITNATVDQAQKFSRSLEQDSIINCIKGDRFSAGCLESLSLGGEMDPGFQQQQPLPQAQQQPLQPVDPMNRELLIQQFCSATNMNHQYSKKCLEENAYDLQKSYDVFTQLHSQGVIPPAAFDR